MNIIDKKISVLVVLGLAAVFSLALVSTAQAGALTNASTTFTSNYGGILSNYTVSFGIATQNDDIGRINLGFPSNFGMPGAEGTSLATSSITVSPGTILLASTTITSASVTLDLGTSSTYAAGTTVEISNIGQFLNPYVGGSFQIAIETRTEKNVLIDSANTAAFSIVNAPDGPAQAISATTVTTVTPPGSKITSPTVGQAIAGGQSHVIKGTASDQGLYAVSKVEVSVDNGSTWATAELTKVSASNFTWEYTWTSPAAGSYTLKSKATDTAGNAESPGTGVSVTVSAADSGAVPTTVSELQAKITELRQMVVNLLQKLVQLLTQQLQGLTGGS